MILKNRGQFIPWYIQNVLVFFCFLGLTLCVIAFWFDGFSAFEGRSDTIAWHKTLLVFGYGVLVCVFIREQSIVSSLKYFGSKRIKDYYKARPQASNTHLIPDDITYTEFCKTIGKILFLIGYLYWGTLVLAKTTNTTITNELARTMQSASWYVYLLVETNEIATLENYQVHPGTISGYLNQRNRPRQEYIRRVDIRDLMDNKVCFSKNIEIKTQLRDYVYPFKGCVVVTNPSPKVFRALLPRFAWSTENLRTSMLDAICLKGQENCNQADIDHLRASQQIGEKLQEAFFEVVDMYPELSPYLEMI